MPCSTERWESFAHAWAFPRRVCRPRPWLAIGALLLLGGCGPELSHVTACEPGSGLTPICGFVNPEDLAAVPDSDWLLVSQFPGVVVEEGEPVRGTVIAFRPSDGARRVLYPLEGRDGRADLGDPACTEPPDAAGFTPHGLDLRDGLLAVVNHGGREALELFSVASSEEGPVLTWRGCVVLPDDAMANDVALLSDGRLATTRMMPRGSSPMTILRVSMGWNTGWVLLWDRAEGWRPWPGTEDSAPNGVAVAPDDGAVFYASWSRQAVVRVDADGRDRREVALGHHVDNLTWTPDGKLLAAGQGGSLTSVLACAEKKAGTCGMPFFVDEIDPDSLEVERLISHDPARVGGAASVALEHDGVVWVGTFSGDRLLAWSRP